MKIEAVGRRYREFVLNVLTKAGVDEDVGAKAFKEAHQYWIAEFKHHNCKKDPLNNPMEEFMKKMSRIDKKWIDIILEVVPSNKREHVAMELSTENAEYGAMARGSLNDLHLDAIQAIRQIASWDNVKIHVASSARSSHVKGVVDLAGLEDIIDTIIGFDTVQAPKKAPGSKYYERMLERVHASSENSFFVGDSAREAIQSLKHGMRFILIDRTGRAAHTIPVCIKEEIEIFDSMDEVPAFIKQCISKSPD